jgi:hypothetical protein
LGEGRRAAQQRQHEGRSDGLLHRCAPGVRPRGPLCVPLHQGLRLRT